MPDRNSPPPPPPQRRPPLSQMREPSTLDQIKAYARDAAENAAGARSEIEALRRAVEGIRATSESAARRAGRIEDALPLLGDLVIQSGPVAVPLPYRPPPMRRPLDTHRHLPGVDDSQTIELPAFPQEALKAQVEKTLESNELTRWRKRKDAFMDIAKVILGGAGAVGFERLVTFLFAHH